MFIARLFKALAFTAYVSLVLTPLLSSAEVFWSVQSLIQPKALAESLSRINNNVGDMMCLS